MGFKTESRPAPLPPRPSTPFGVGRVALPEGASGWSKVWVDAAGLPHTSAHPVPVDADGRRTEHVRHTCRGKIEVAGQVQPCDHMAWLLPGTPTKFCPDHGAPLEPDQPIRSGVPWAQVWDDVNERIRVAGVAAGVAGVTLAVDLTPMPWWAHLVQVTSLPAVVLSSWWLTRWWLLRQDEKRNRLDPNDQVAGKRRRRLAEKRARIAAYSATAAGLLVQAGDWGDITTHPGRAVVWAAVLTASAVVCSRPYRAYVDQSRRARAEELKAELVEPGPAVVETPPGVIAAQKWVEHDPNGALPNTVLVPDSWREVVGGWAIVIRATKPGAVGIEMFTDQSAKGRLRTISGTFGVHRKYLNFVECDDPNEVLMLVQPNPPLVEGKVWLGPESIDVDKGIAHSGYYLDGSDLWEPYYKYGWGAPSKLVLGTTGSGKSENLRKQIIIERYFAVPDPAAPGGKRGLFATFLHDFKQFESYGEFRAAVHAAGSTRDDAYIMRDALIREMHRRYAMLASYVWYDKKGRRREGGIKWDPRIHGPILSWIIDEFHEIAKDADFIGPLELLARKMRACGIRITIGTHMGTLGDTGSRGFRDMLAGGYAILGRTTDSLTSVVTGGQLTADPRQLPKLPGMCLVADGEQKTMHARQTYIPADEDAPVNVYDLLYDDNNNPIGYPAVLPPETLEAFGPEWVEWAEAGKRPGGRPEGNWRPSAPAAHTTAVSPSGEGDVQSAKEVVLSILVGDGGPMDIDTIDKALVPHRARGVKCSVSMARKVLKALVDDGVAFKPGHGLYQISPHVQEDLLAQFEEQLEAAQ